MIAVYCYFQLQLSLLSFPRRIWLVKGSRQEVIGAISILGN